MKTDPTFTFAENAATSARNLSLANKGASYSVIEVTIPETEKELAYKIYQVCAVPFDLKKGEKVICTYANGDVLNAYEN